MVKVVLNTTLAQQFTAGRSEVEVEASSVRQMIAALDADFPGLGEEIRNTMAIAVDGEILPDPWLEAIRPESEIYILARIGGG